MIAKNNNKIEKVNYDLGPGLKYDGVNAYVNCGDTSFLNFIHETFIFSTSIIYKPLVANPTDVKFLFTNNAGSNFRGIRLSHRPNSSLVYSIANGTNTDSIIINDFFADNDLITITVISDLTGFSIYKNGVLFTSQNHTISPIAGDAQYALRIGTGFGTPIYAQDGIIYDLKIFDKKLNQSEITELHTKNGQIVPTTTLSNLITNWKFSDKSGTTLKDYSGNGYDGTLINFDDTSIGATNAWVDKYGNSLTQV